MKKKLLAILMCATLALSMVACGGKEEPAAEEPAATEEVAEETAEPAPTEEGVELVYWSMWNETEPQAEAIKEAIAAYEATSGNTVKVEWKGRDIYTIIGTALEAGEKIDLFDDDSIRIASQHGDFCMDLEEMATAADYASHSVEALPTAVRAAAGSLKVIAYQPFTSGIFYNKAIFEEAGIEKEPATWAEFLDCCQKIKDAGYAPLVQDDAYVMFAYGFQIARYMGQDAVKELCLNGGWAESEGALKAAQDIENLVKSGYYSEYAPGTYPENENEIGYGEAAMIVNASWVPAEITNNTDCDIEWGMFNYPTVEGGVDPATISVVGAQGFAIPAYSENGQAAFDLIMTITTGEYDQKMALSTSGIPADPTNEEWPEMIAGCREGFNSLTNVYEWDCGLDANADLVTVLSDNLMKLFEGTYTAADFIAAVDAASK